MPISFPGNPTTGQTFNQGNLSYRFDGKRWVPITRNLVLSGNTITLDSATITATGNIINLPAGSTIGGVPIGGGSLSALSDVQIVGTPGLGQVLKWNGTKWSPASDLSGGGGGGGVLPGYLNNYFIRDEYVGTGSTYQFVLSETPLNFEQVQIFVDNVFQNNSAYTLSADTITFNEPPPAGSKVEAVAFITNTTSIFFRDNFVGDGANNAFTLTATPVQPETTLVYINGQNQPLANFSVVGNSLSFASPPDNGAVIEAIVFTTLIAGLGSIDNFADVDLSIAPGPGQALIFDSNIAKWKAGNVGGSISVSTISGNTAATPVTNVTAIRFDAGGFTVADLGSGAVRVTNLGGGGGAGGIIKTYNILNDFTAPLIGTQVFVPVSPATITRVQITNSGVAGSDIMLGLYRNNVFLEFFTLPTGQQSVVISGVNISINTNDYITVNVVAGSGKNLTMVLLST